MARHVQVVVCRPGLTWAQIRTIFEIILREEMMNEIRFRIEETG